MPVPLVSLLIAVAALALLARAARSATTVCVVEVRDGRAQVTHGGIAPRLLADLGDVVARPAVARATVRITRSSGAAEVKMTGDLSAPQQQQIRNVIGSVPLAQLSNARARR